MVAIKNTGDTPGDHAGRATGGDVKPKEKRENVQVYNANGSNEVDEATDEKPAFKRGGRNRRDGGAADGETSGQRMDRAARGGSMKREHHASGGRTGGNSPYSSGANLATPTDDKAGRGHENASPA